MIEHGGFEGNGHTLRILSLIEPYHERYGMNLSRRSLLGVLKYPAPYSAVVNPHAYESGDCGKGSIFKAKPFKPPKCYMDTERDVVGWISTGLEDWPRVSSEFETPAPMKHRKTIHKSLDASIMEVADDIAYGVHDLEDAVGLKLVNKQNFSDMVSKDDLYAFCGWADGLNYDDLIDRLFSDHTFQRKKAIGALVDFCVRHTSLSTANSSGFKNPIFALRAELSEGARQVLGALQRLVEKTVIFTTTVQQLEFKGQKIVTELFQAFATDPTRLLPLRDAKRWQDAQGDPAMQHRVICDHVAGMTDEYATKRYQQMFEPRIGSVFDRL